MASCPHHVLSRLAIAVLAASVHAGALDVPAQYPTIQAAVDAAQPWDVVVIAPGTYRENVVCDVDFLFIAGWGVTIDGQYKGPCLVSHGDWLNVTALTCVNGGIPGATEEGDGVGGLLVAGQHVDLREV